MFIIITTKNFIIKLHHITSNEQVKIHHNIDVKTINLIEKRQTMFSTNFVTAIHHIFRKGLVSEPYGKSKYSTII